MLVAQLTDTHVMRAGTTRRLMGDTAAHLARAVAWLSTLSPGPDAVVLTGDLVDSADLVEYGRLRETLRPLAVPYYLVPGNHDRAPVLREAFPEHAYLPSAGPLHFAIDDHPVRIVAFDSTMRGRAGGYADATSLRWLERTLAADLTKPTILCLHHPPFRTGMHYMDAFGFVGMSGLRAVVAGNPQVRLVISGHIHRALRTTLEQAVLWTSASTAPQVVPEILERRPLWLRFEQPGLSLHEWKPANGSFTSQLFRAKRGGGFAASLKLDDLPAARSHPTRPM